MIFSKNLSPELRKILSIIFVFYSSRGFCFSLCMYTWALILHDKIIDVATPQMAITIPAILFGIQKAFVFLFEIPTGAYGDAIGRKKTVIWSLRFRMVFFSLFALIPFLNSLFWIVFFAVVCQIFLSLAQTFYSGTMTAWIVDSIRNADPSFGYENFLSKSSLYMNVAAIFGGVFGIFCYTSDFSYVAYLAAGFIYFLCVMFFENHMPQLDQAPSQMKENKDVLKRMGEIITRSFRVFKSSKSILILIIPFSAFIFVIQLTDRLWPVYTKEISSPKDQTMNLIVLVVVVQVILSLGSYVLTKLTEGQQHNGKMENKKLINIFTIATTLIGITVLSMSSLTFFELDSVLYFSLALVFMSFVSSFVTPVFQTLINNLIPEKFSGERATILSFASLMRSFLIFFLAPLSAGSSGARTTIGWALPAILLLFSAIIGYFYLRKEQKKIPIEHINI